MCPPSNSYSNRQSMIIRWSKLVLYSPSRTWRKVSLVILGMLSGCPSWKKCGRTGWCSSSISMTVCKVLGIDSHFGFITSPGCSNILKDRRNCFLGRINGFEGLLEWLPIGEPFRSDPDILPKGLLTRGKPMTADADGLLADCGLRSWTGDSKKHSSRDMDVEVDSLLLPAPKRKGGHCESALQGPWCRLLIDNPLVRARDGRSKIDLRRLSKLA